MGVVSVIVHVRPAGMLAMTTGVAVVSVVKLPVDPVPQL